MLLKKLHLVKCAYCFFLTLPVQSLATVRNQAMHSIVDLNDWIEKQLSDACNISGIDA